MALDGWRWSLLGAAMVSLACPRPNPAYHGRMTSYGDGATPADAVWAAEVAPDRSAPDGGIVSDALLSVPDVVSPTACGTGRADISTIVNADGIAVGADGTLYFTTRDDTDGFVGRVLPGRPPDVEWLTIAGAPETWGIALDGARNKLYVLSVSGSALMVFDDITGTPTRSVVVSNVVEPDDVVVATDGTVYYTNQSDRHIYRVPPGSKQAIQVTVASMPIGDLGQTQAPAALAFLPDSLAPERVLIVGMKHGGALSRITLAGGVEQLPRVSYGTWLGWANGLAFDRRGHLYVGMYQSSATSVIRLEADGTRPTTLLTGGRYSSLAFGRGALDCHDLYVADLFGPMRRINVPDSQ
jgi:hypothetical protein